MKRILTAILLIAAVFAILFLGPLWLLATAAALVAGLAAYEYRALAHQNERLRERLNKLEAKLGLPHDPRDDDQHLPYEGDEMPRIDGG